MISDFGFRISETPPTHPARETRAPHESIAAGFVGQPSRLPGGWADRASSIQHRASGDWP